MIQVLFISLIVMKMSRQLYLEAVEGKGRGVFCTATYANGEIIEVCPVVVIPASDFNAVGHTTLMDYSFYFNKDEKLMSMVMGFGSMYNHAQFPNADFVIDRENRQLVITAREEITAGTEICINYGGEYGMDYQKWFDDRNIVAL